MRTARTAIALAAALTLLAAPGTAGAQQTDEARVDSLQARIERLEARIDSLIRVVAELRAEGARAEADAAEDELADLRAAAEEAAAAAGEERRDQAREGGSRTRSLQALNPEISVTGDVVGSFTDPAGEGGGVTAVPREFEFSFQSALDPYTRTKIFVTHEEPFEIAGVGGDEGEEEGGFELEEAHMYWVGLPGGLGLKVGKFRQEIGLYNRWHTHALFEVDRPLAVGEFLGEGGLKQTGASVTLPSLSTGAGTQTLFLEATRGNAGALFEGGDEISWLGRLVSFWDLSAASYLQLGVTGLYGENDDEGLNTRLLEVDLSYRWTPPGSGLYEDLRLSAEWYFSEKNFPGLERSGNGGWLQASYRLNRSWILGARADYLDGYGGGRDLHQVAPSVTWWQSEWVRLRLQYNHLWEEDGGPTHHTLTLQTVWAVGPHKHEHY